MSQTKKIVTAQQIRAEQVENRENTSFQRWNEWMRYALHFEFAFQFIVAPARALWPARPPYLGIDICKVVGMLPHHGLQG